MHDSNRVIDGVETFQGGNRSGVVDDRPPRILSVVQADTVIGSVKPLVTLSRLVAQGKVAGQMPVRLCVTTRRRGLMSEGMPFADACAEAGLPLVVVPESFPFDPRILGGLNRAIDDFHPDIVESHDFKSHAMTWIVRARPRRDRFRWIAFHHGYTRMSTRVAAYQQIDRLSLPNADRIITVCRPFVSDLVSRGVNPQRVEVLSNFIETQPRANPDVLSALRKELGVLDSDLVVVCVGRLSPEKGHLDLLDALSLIPDRFGERRVRLLIVGDGGERERVRAASNALGDRVVLAGYRADPWPFYCMADVFVLPSHSEGSPLALLEALAAGLPVVATRVGGVPDLVVDEESALIVPSHDSAALEGALTRVMCDPLLRERLGKGSLSVARTQTAQGYSTRLNAAYRSVLNSTERR